MYGMLECTAWKIPNTSPHGWDAEFMYLVLYRLRAIFSHRNDQAWNDSVATDIIAVCNSVQDAVDHVNHIKPDDEGEEEMKLNMAKVEAGEVGAAS